VVSVVAEKLNSAKVVKQGGKKNVKQGKKTVKQEKQKREDENQDGNQRENEEFKDFLLKLYMESPDYMVLNPMRITILTKEFKLLGEIPHSKKHVANKKEQEEIYEFIDNTKLNEKIPLVIEV
jgi:hypothetical protein